MIELVEAEDGAHGAIVAAAGCGLALCCALSLPEVADDDQERRGEHREDDEHHDGQTVVVADLEVLFSADERVEHAQVQVT